MLFQNETDNAQAAILNAELQTVYCDCGKPACNDHNYLCDSCDIEYQKDCDESYAMELQQVRKWEQERDVEREAVANERGMTIIQVSNDRFEQDRVLDSLATRTRFFNDREFAVLPRNDWGGFLKCDILHFHDFMTAQQRDSISENDIEIYFDFVMFGDFPAYMKPSPSWKDSQYETDVYELGEQDSELRIDCV